MESHTQTEGTYSVTVPYQFVPIFQDQLSQNELACWQCCQTGSSIRHFLMSQHIPVPGITYKIYHMYMHVYMWYDAMLYG